MKSVDVEQGDSDLSAGTHIVVVVLLLLRLLVAFWPAVVASGLDTHDIAVPGWRADRGQLQQLLVRELLVVVVLIFICTDTS